MVLQIFSWQISNAGGLRKHLFRSMPVLDCENHGESLLNSLDA
jgi:hypothetical protein